MSAHAAAAGPRWEFWLDVGGTFTDCLARRPDGTLVRHKVLSSATTKGCAAAGSTSMAICDPARRADPAGFWVGYQLRLLDGDGQLAAQAMVREFAAGEGRLLLAAPLGVAPLPGQRYELTSGEESPLLAIRYLLGLPLATPIGPVVVRLGTTRGTNALLTRSGARTALATTLGLGDVLQIGYQNRPRLFDLDIQKPAPLFSAVVEIDERITADGQPLRAPNVNEVRRQLAQLRQSGVESLAICLLNAYRNPAHELMVTDAAREVGFQEISVSHQTASLVKIVARGDTTVMDAYLNPVLRNYVSRLRQQLAGSDVRIMTSAGALVTAERFEGKDSILSGPAGGVVGFSQAAQEAGFTRAIGFDMGGTSTDVSRFEDRFELEYETEKAGVRVVAPMMAIETVAAGGGSICGFDGVKLIVGPASAGAEPGPACYGRGGPLTVTDANFFLGKILPQRFPFPLDWAAVERRLQMQCDEIAAATGRRFAPAELCNGYLRVANANMVRAIRSISIAKGRDPADYVLVAFGGAAPQHACAVARELGMRQVLVHPDAGVLSAYGIGRANVARHHAAGVYETHTPQALAKLANTFEALEAAGRRELLAEGIAPQRIAAERSLDLRYRGNDHWLTIPQPANSDYAAAFEVEHRARYGYAHPGRALEIVAARVEAVGRSQRSATAPTKPSLRRAATPVGQATVHFAAGALPTALYERSALSPGETLPGPAIVAESLSTVVIDPGWQAEVLAGGELLLTDAAVGTREQVSTAVDPVMLEVFNHQFAGIAEQMGITLRNTSSSVNVKERLDFSCAVFTAAGELVVNAPHIPVHLGAMGQTVRQLLVDNPALQPGDVLATNDPYRGGSHLPDVTVVTPVHDRASGRLIFFTASRAHHAEIGGIRPGSMPPFSRRLAEEGVLIRNFKLVDRGVSRFDEFAALLASGPYPSRSVADNLADAAAQVAANQQGARDLGQMVERYGLEVVLAYMGHIQRAAEQKVRHSLARLPQGRHTFCDHLDDGSPICVAIDLQRDKAVIDFTGTGPVLAGNLNANRAIVTAAVMYVLRALIDEDIPLNEGVLAPVEIVLPECLLNPPDEGDPAQCAAVVGGNVETSQRVVDVLLGALGLAAASQGTMNNLTFGDATFGYYETICGGAGATPRGRGADAVHTHMTNTRLTDPEVLEQRCPVRLREFSIRRGSGGAGQHRGGDGIVRRIEFLRPLDVSILSERRGPYPPYGQAGGAAGQCGMNTLTHADGRHEPLPAKVQFVAQAGDVLTIETPGGGGWGAA